MNAKKGFTLIEILIALTIFAIIASISATILYNTLNTREKVNRQADALAELQSALALMQRDFAQVIDRPVRDSAMHVFPAFIGLEQSVEFTKDGAVNFNGSSLERVAFLCHDGRLYRRRWAALDAPNHAKQFSDRIILTGLRHCAFSYLDASLHVLPQWQAQKEAPFPHAVKIDCTVEGMGKASLLYPIPEGLYAKIP